MAKFYAYCVDSSLRDCNGGSLVLYHHLCALKQLGHQSGGMLNLTDEVPEDADYIMFQSEWWGHLQNPLARSKAKRICWVGHYNTHKRYAMPKLAEIEADFYHTQYIGEAVAWGEKQLKSKIYYLPHAGCNLCNVKGKQITEFTSRDHDGKMIQQPVPKKVIIRNQFKERTEDWLDYAGVEKRNAPFDQIKDIYRSANVCPNLQADFQKNIICEFFQTPAEMINERIFQVTLSGGFCISDNSPIVKKFFTQDEVPYCQTKEEYREVIEFFAEHPDERLPYMEKALNKINKHHTYVNRWKDYLTKIV